MAESFDDAWLVDRARSGSVEAFEQLVRQHRDPVYRLALRLTGSPEDAQDVAQEALLEAWRQLERFRGDSAFGTWLYRIVVNRAHNSRRSSGRTELPGELPERASRERPDHDTESAHRRSALLDAIARLPFERRAPLVLHQFEGLSYADTASVLGVTVDTVRMRIHRARRDLATEMQGWR